MHRREKKWIPKVKTIPNVSTIFTRIPTNKQQVVQYTTFKTLTVFSSKQLLSPNSLAAAKARTAKRVADKIIANKVDEKRAAELRAREDPNNKEFYAKCALYFGKKFEVWKKLYTAERHEQHNLRMANALFAASTENTPYVSSYDVLTELLEDTLLKYNISMMSNELNNLLKDNC